jgi:hypothetical protein
MAGTAMTGTNIDYYNAPNETLHNIGVVNFDFNWYNINYGVNNTINWYSKSALIFGSDQQSIGLVFAATEINGFLTGFSKNRTLISANQFASTNINNYKIKQFIVKHGNIDNTPDEIEMTIKLIRGLSYQYIAIEITKWYQKTSEHVSWVISNKSTFTEILGRLYTSDYPMFSYTLSITPPKTYLLRSNLQGNDWTLDTTTDLNDLLTPIDTIGAIIPTSITNPLQYERPIYNTKPSKSNFQ